MDEESFEHWMSRREQERRRMKGRMRLDALNSHPRRGSHVFPEAPRLISRWDGYSWEPVAVASHWAAAAALLYSHDVADERTERQDPGRVARAVQDSRLRGAGTAERKKARVRELLDEGHYRPEGSGG
ncbi:DUF6087 family protein [Streptomyces sp. NBC_01217]|uniref:DUF6087 family protein n=1 Tax=Streptomyces sp. NBC_01217 TaxID=2903779 RepID=UPI002E11B1F6|nr:DUF6087 family protein [Streptomyces sp. NBC_01217]